MANSQPLGQPSPYANLFKNLLSSFPNNLRKLQLDLQGPHRDLYAEEDPDQLPFTNLQTLLNAQTQLVDVSFGFVSFPVKWTLDAFTSLANSCAHTLRYLELHGFPNQGSGVFDLKMLSVCASLEVLHMPSWGRACMTFRNVEKLPTSLKRLVICEGETGEIEIEDPNVFKRLIALEWLYLFGINMQITSNCGNQGPEREFCRTMMKGLLSLRKLEGFCLQVQVIGLNKDPCVVKMLRALCRNIDPTDRLPLSFVSFNLEWRWYRQSQPPWSDRPFYKATLDKEKKEAAEKVTGPGLGQTVKEIDENEADKMTNDVDEDMQKDENADVDMNEEEDAYWSDEDD